MLTVLPCPECASPFPMQTVLPAGSVLVSLGRGEAALEGSPDNLQRLMTLACKEMRAHDDSWPFREPVPLDEVRLGAWALRTG